MTPGVYEVLSSTQLPLPGLFLLSVTFSLKAGDGCNVVKIPGQGRAARQAPETTSITIKVT